MLMALNFHFLPACSVEKKKKKSGNQANNFGFQGGADCAKPTTDVEQTSIHSFYLCVKR